MGYRRGSSHEPARGASRALGYVAVVLGMTLVFGVAAGCGGTSDESDRDTSPPADVTLPDADTGAIPDSVLPDGKDTGPVPDTSIADVPDGGAPPDIAPPSDAGDAVEDVAEDVGLGEFLSSCISNRDCASGWCVPGPEAGFVCTQQCSLGCPDDWSCRRVEGTEPDYVYVCFYSSDLLCSPCVNDGQCGDGLCLDYEDGAACGRVCETGEDCPEGFACEERTSTQDQTRTLNLCVPTTGTCTCTTLSEGRERACRNEDEFGVCWGTEICEGMTGWGECSASHPASESCDGFDNDCDGTVDEELALPELDCEEQNAFGTCPGNWVCRGQQGWDCVVFEPPAEESCDFRDNDCDGQTDENFRDQATGFYSADEHCGTCGADCRFLFANAVGVCDASGPTPRCVADCNEGYFSPRDPATGQINDQICIPRVSSLCLRCSIDANCVVPGDRCLEIGDARYCGRNCDEDSVHGGECPAGYECDEVQTDVWQCVPTSGSCDCLPENVNMERSCTVSNASGTCTGVEVCDEGLFWSPCSAAIPSLEVCDGLDNDCNGYVDDDPPEPPEVCQTTWTDPDTMEEAVCPGDWICTPADGAASWVCGAPQAGPDVCNYVDDDCDGETDEAFRDPTTGRYVDLENCGSCGYSCVDTIPNATERCNGDLPIPLCEVESCDPGFFLLGTTTCLPLYDPACQPCVEDSNCGVPGSLCLPTDGGGYCGRDCSEGNVHGTDAGVCPEGFECRDLGEGISQCVPATDSCTCYLQEHDLDTRLCTRSNEFGVCTGEQTCAVAGGGWSSCTAAVPALEECNGIDDDCDGTVDTDVEVPPPPIEDCFNDNEFGYCTGNWVCAGLDLWQCTAAVPAAETCDYLDNNCNDEIDEGFRDPTTGTYNTYDNCGVCGFSCEGAVLRALSTECVTEGDIAVCKPVECEEGFVIPPENDRICVSSTGATDCQPCSVNAHCDGLDGGACLPLDRGSFCFRTCAVPEDCPPSYTCSDEGRCLPESGSCTCLPGDELDIRPCFIQNENGTCAGEQQCAPAAGGWSLCNADIPEAEACNGLDDNCNSLVDEAVFRDPPTCELENAIGICPGVWTCEDVAGTRDWVCSGREASEELCDYVDNDCNGITDDGFRDPTTGRYGGLENCGTCGYSCVGTIPDATEYCNGSLTYPLCEVESCDPGFYLVGTTTCLPLFDPACQPCVEDANCDIPGSVCVQLDGRGFCGRDCADGNVFGTDAGVCPEDFSCHDLGEGVFQCLPTTDSCTCYLAEHDQATRLCTSSNEFGVCTGEQSCSLADGGWSLCTAATPALEACNGIDDDCDGIVDTDAEIPPPPIEDCVNDNEFGICTGDWVCAGVDEWQCTALVPAPEICDYVDNNCNDEVDETFRDPTTGAYNAYEHCGVCGFTCEGAVPRALSTECVVDGTLAVCKPTACEEGFEIPPENDRICVSATGATDCQPCSVTSHCDGLEGGDCFPLDRGSFCFRACAAPEDCPVGYACAPEGRCLPDSGSCTCLPGDDGAIRPCFIQNENGSCAGQQECLSSAGGWTPCDADTPIAELCNGADDNCNGLIDEGVLRDPPTCQIENGLGICPGVWTCQNQGATSDWVCSGRAATPDVCDYIDNDCDSFTDEGFRDPITGRYVDLQNCGSCGYSCVGTIPDATEYCNGDLSYPLCEVESCDPGFYQVGTTTCLPLFDPACQPCVEDANCEIPGSVCVQLDGGGFCGRDCAAGNVHGTDQGICPAGFSCNDLGDGVFQCLPDTGSCTCLLPEDNLDTRLCTVPNEFGVCTGEQTCELAGGGWTPCTAATPAAEECNGVDDDCDGLVDEDVVSPPIADCFNENAFGICTGDWVCAGVSLWECTALVPAPETCDYVDNNCNDQVDEGFRDPATGAYGTYENCGVCGFSCEGAVPRALTTECVIEGDYGVCKPIVCEDGFEIPPENDRICVSATGATDCQPCSVTSHCDGLAGGDCLDLDRGSYCLRSCGAPEDCPTGYTCSVEGRCLPDSGSCSCLPGDGGDVRSCFIQNAFGTCEGDQVCNPTGGGWSLCNADTPIAEICNGADDNCNGLVDEDVSRDPPTCDIANGIGICPGVWACQDQGGVTDWVCTGRAATTEICDYIDNDCNGSTDENVDDLYTSCSIGLGECESVGFRECSVDGLSTVCNAEQIPEGVEICNGLDDDCDGFTDEDEWPLKGEVCVVGLGECENTGVYVCNPGAPAGPTVCSVQPGPETSEVCDGVDNDCNGATDEALLWADKGGVCSVGVGACRASGVYACNTANPAGALICSAAPGTGIDELCNGIDDDCDGSTDEAGDLIAPACAEQDGVCANSMQTCGGTSLWLPCTGPEYGPLWERVELTCDGRDNDCDGATDEDLTAPLCLEQQGVCRGSRKICEGSTGWGTCTGPEYGPSYESPEVSCDFLDNNCDGETDDPFRDPATGRYVALEHCGSCGNSCVGAIPNATAYCNGSLPTPVCQVQTCDAGYYLVGTSTCLPVTDPSCQPCVEDANCGVPGSVCVTLDGGGFCGRDCAAGNVHGAPAGVCEPDFECVDVAVGVRQCLPTTGSCSCLLPEHDGDTRLCTRTNAAGTCTGSQECNLASGGWSDCTALVPSLEDCDGIDDDCDGFVDEDVVEPIEPCENQVGNDVCTGDWICAGIDGWQCNAPIPSAESCDYVDNDCDGATDELFRDPVTGIYDDYTNCGVCGFTCEGAVLRALTTQCVIEGTTAVCKPVTCEEGFEIPAENDRICVSATGAADCQPCSVTAHCDGLVDGDCRPLDRGSYCLRSCTGPADCPLDYDCIDNVCEPLSGSCSCLPEDDGDIRSCLKTNPFGTCTGTQTCNPTTGWSTCTADTPAAEDCNGEDDNCNGLIDEGVSRDPATCDITNGDGTCQGLWVCEDQGATAAWVCAGRSATPEVCDYIDNDCNGSTDENVADLYDSCSLGLGECEGIGFRECAPDGLSTVCNAEEGTAGAETCNDLDDDCDGSTDEEQWADKGTVCVVGIGACQRAGVRICDPVDPTGPTVCSVSAGSSSTEACDEIDNDCDGATDEGPLWDDKGNVCTAGVGACTAAGVYVCDSTDPTAAVVCTAVALPAGLESCNGVDDDCDGQTDELTDLDEPPCVEQDGVCLGSFQTCGGASSWRPCTGPEYGADWEPVELSCDGLDNDCDGATDEDVPPPPCDEQRGVCAGSAKTCGGASLWLGCTGPEYGPFFEPVEATCDFLDNDCDGATDEAFRDPATGLYVTQQHCGVCGNDCTGSIPNATAICDASFDPPRCVVDQCDAGFIEVNGTQCLPPSLGLCEACVTADTCLLPGAVCAPLDDGSYCLNPCYVEADCPPGFSCTTVGAGDYCTPDTNACQCDGSNTDLQRGCVESYPPAGPPEYFCFGFEDCTVTGWSGCFLPGEECNLVDDDCDGAVDEDFVDGSGRYTSDVNCGECGNNCTLLEFGGLPGVCNVIVDPPVCSVQCTGNCFDVNANPADGCECCDPTPTDPPDPLGLDENCDGMDGEKDNGIFVAKNGSDSNSGFWGAPMLTIRAGIEAAALENVPYVYVATGVYEESLVLQAGVSVFGGYRSDFKERDRTRYEVAVLSPQPAAGFPGAVNAIGLSGGAAGSVTFDGFTIFGYTERRSGVSSYAIYISECDDTVTVTNNRIYAGVGGKGFRGADGADGTDGTPGGLGTDALDIAETYSLPWSACDPVHHTVGGLGGALTCGAASTSGGDGGNRVCPQYPFDDPVLGNITYAPVASEDGIAGTAGGVAGAGGSGGSAGWDVYHSRFSCEGYNTYGPVEGGVGGDGPGGTDGGAGNGCVDAVGAVVGGLWSPGTAGTGLSGTSGGGGGGGGSGAGAFVESSCGEDLINGQNLGGTGGGGGAGGCGGVFGTGGTSGGGSFAIFVTFAADPAGDVPTLSGNRIYGGVGGAGGDGGNGGTGGSGGSGGLGGLGGGTEPTDPTYPAFKGGKGGNGGDGGHGGGGGGGCGGSAYGIYAWGQGSTNLSAWTTANVFAMTGSGGSAGTGGFSLGQPGSDGLAGAAQDTNF